MIVFKKTYDKAIPVNHVVLVSCNDDDIWITKTDICKDTNEFDEMAIKLTKEDAIEVAQAIIDGLKDK